MRCIHVYPKDIRNTHTRASARVHHLLHLIKLRDFSIYFKKIEVRPSENQPTPFQVDTFHQHISHD